MCVTELGSFVNPLAHPSYHTSPPLNSLSPFSSLGCHQSYLMFPQCLHSLRLLGSCTWHILVLAISPSLLFIFSQTLSHLVAIFVMLFVCTLPYSNEMNYVAFKLSDFIQHYFFQVPHILVNDSNLSSFVGKSFISHRYIFFTQLYVEWYSDSFQNLAVTNCAQKGESWVMWNF